MKALFGDQIVDFELHNYIVDLVVRLRRGIMFASSSPRTLQSAHVTHLLVLAADVELVLELILEL